MPNKIIVTPEEKPKDQDPGLSDTLKKVSDFDFNISNAWVRKQIPFALFVVFLLMLHIWNVQNTERFIRKTDKLNKEMKELRSEYISILSELMSQSKQSTVAEKLDSTGIRELRTPPVKITYSGSE